MSYEKVKIIGVRQIVKQKTGQVHHFLQVEVLQAHDLYLNDDALKLMPVYDAMKGQYALLPLTHGEYNGKPSFNLADDARPLPLAPVAAPISANPTPSELPAATKSPLFKGN